MIRSPAIAAAAVALLAACASQPPPRSLARASQAINAATQVNAAAAAPLEMRLAHEKLDAAKAAAQQDRNAEADRLAEEAVANAELAQAKTEEAKSKAALSDVRESVDALRAPPATAPRLVPMPPPAAAPPIR
jgi:hypothetical protein